MPRIQQRVQTTSVATPIDDATVAQLKLGDARIELAGTLALKDYRKLLELRADAFGAATALRHAALGGMFRAEYATGARHARQAGQLLGRVNFLYASIVDGEPTADELRQFERAAHALLRRAQGKLERAYAAAYTGTHY
jgi:hypothetical protein